MKPSRRNTNEAAAREPAEIGPALLETLGDLNSGVREALADERARLRNNGYADDLPQPALWWTPSARPELVVLSDSVA